MKKILGMGNAVLDILAPVTEDFLESKNLIKGSMSLVDQKVSDKILQEINPIKKDSGGSVANSIVGISLLGMNASFCGKVRDDDLGNTFIKEMQDSKTNFLCKQSSDGLSTARCIVFVTPDGERSMQTFLGASTTLSADDIEEAFFEDIDYLLIEGYLWSSETARNAIEKAINISKIKKIKVIFSLSDSNLVKMYKSDFKSFIISSVDILIGNENEYSELFEDNEERVLSEKYKLEIMVKTKGKNGAEVFQHDKKDHVASFEVESVLDTTGAGDMFAAGFLYNLLKDKNPLEAAVFGCKVAAAIIQQYGARPTKQILEKLIN